MTDADNDYVITPDLYIIGNPNPDWLGSFITDATWKGITFAFQVDYVQGRHVLHFQCRPSLDGACQATFENFDPGLPLILPGVKETDESVVNDGILTTAGVFYTQSILEGLFRIRKPYDATRVRLREVSLSYNIPQSLTSKLSIRSANISLVGNKHVVQIIELAQIHPCGFRPHGFGTGNGAGFEYLGAHRQGDME